MAILNESYMGFEFCKPWICSQTRHQPCYIAWQCVCACVRVRIALMVRINAFFLLLLVFNFSSLDIFKSWYLKTSEIKTLAGKHLKVCRRHFNCYLSFRHISIKYFPLGRHVINEMSRGKDKKNKPAHEKRKIISYATSKGSGETTHKRSLAWAFAVRRHVVETSMKLQSNKRIS